MTSPTPATTPPTPHAPHATDFAGLGLHRVLVDALSHEGYSKPTPIQAQAIVPALAGRDVLGIAQTGTGKTAAFALPILQRLMSQPTDKAHRGAVHPRALILSPTRELATQIGDALATYGKHTGLTHTVIFGGVSQFHQVKAIHRGVDILVATPGRLEDLMQQRLVTLKNVGIFVLDEADRMLDMGFIRPIQRIASTLTDDRQTLLFSATMPREIQHLADGLLEDPVRISVTPIASAAPKIDQVLYHVRRESKFDLLIELLKDPAITRAVVFAKTKHGSDKLARRLHKAGVACDAIHGNKAQNHRTRALEGFRSGKLRVLVATDVASRGIDIDGVSHVFNFDLPMEPEAYVHRIGRTARAGASGHAIAFCDREERDLLRGIERLLRKPIPVLPTPALPEPTPYIPGHADEQDHGGARGRGSFSPRGSSRGPARGDGRGEGRGPSRGPTRGERGGPRDRFPGSHRGDDHGERAPARSSDRPARASGGSHNNPHAPHNPHSPHAPHGAHAPRRNVTGKTGRGRPGR